MGPARMRSRVGGVKVELGSGNVYADLKIKDADAMLRKGNLVLAITQLIRERGLNQTEAAAVLGLTQSKLARILCGQFHALSEYRLNDWLTRLRQ